MKQLISAAVLTSITVTGVFLYPSINAKPVNDPPAPVIFPAPATPTPVTAAPNIAEIAQLNNSIEVAFVLDTTGSMSSLIQGAKENIWSIASSMASAESAPTIKMGLVGYRDRGDQYVTKISDLSDDLDSGYGTLMNFTAAGGGDAPESVNKALYDAVTKMSWGQDDGTYRVIFLVGDAPPKMSYNDEMQYPEIVELARKKGIVINTIQCGQQASTTAPWKQIASLSQGRFFQVEQSGSAVAISTPFDEKLAALSTQLDQTRLFYGSEKVQARKRLKQAASDKFNRTASPASAAKKAEFNISRSGARNFSGDNELLGDLDSGKVSLEEIAVKELPSELRELEQDERQQVLAKKAEDRKKIKQQIAELAAKRSDYVKKELAKTDKAESSLDNQIYQTVRAQAKNKGLVYKNSSAKY